MRIRRRGPLYLALFAAAVLLSLVASQHEQAARGQQASPTPVAAETPAANAMAVDAVIGGAVDATTTVVGTAPFDIGIVTTSAPTPYQGYKYALKWDPAVLAADTAAELEPADFPSCPKPGPERSSMLGSCARTDPGTQFVGAVTIVRFHCVADGVSPLRLTTGPGSPAGDHTTTFAKSTSIETNLTDASVTCQDVGPPAPAPASPPNDDFANAKVVPGLPFRDSIDIAGATGEASGYELGDHTVWYTFTPGTTEFVQADTVGSNFDAVLGVYAGASLASLTAVAFNDDTDGLQSRLVVELAADTTYYFEAGSHFALAGSLVFNLKAAPLPSLAANAIAIDAISGAGVDATRAVRGTDLFDIDIYITASGKPYQGYQYMLQWDPLVLAYDGQENLEPAGFSLCAPATIEGNTLSTGCARAGEATQFVGRVNTVTLHCVADGTGLVHLTTLAEDANFGTVTLGAGGTKIDTALTDASITCQGVGGAPLSPSPTPRPVPPNTGSGGFLDDR